MAIKKNISISVDHAQRRLMLVEHDKELFQRAQHPLIQCRHSFSEDRIVLCPDTNLQLLNIVLLSAIGFHRELSQQNLH